MGSYWVNQFFGMQLSFQIGPTVCGRAFADGDTGFRQKERYDMQGKGIFILTNPFEGDNYRAAFILHELS